MSGNDRAYATLSNLDFSHASLYTVNITDPNGSVTNFSDFRVLPDVPHSTLDANIGSSVRKDFCTTTPILCPDGEILTAMTLTKTPLSPTQVVANGTDKYDFTLKIRDRYGNATNGGSVKIEYTDTVDTIQETP